MSFHLNAHFPIVSLLAALVGLCLVGVTTRQPWHELGRALLWGGIFVALLQSQG